MLFFYYYDDLGHCVGYESIQINRKECNFKPESTETVNGFTPLQFSDQIRSDFGTFGSSNPHLLITFGSAVAIKLVLGFFRK